uniref:Ubiquitin-like domain-containing protein n=1 Tax=Anolis carolinensis TaxID=28377 RepID=A0A803T927_ANOCA
MSQGQEEPGCSAKGALNEPRLISVVVRSPTEAHDVQVSEGSTVGQLKEQAALHFNLSKDRILLVFAGKVLRSRETLLQHNIRDGLTVHLVIRKTDADSVLPDHNAATPPLALVSEVPAFLDNARKDLAALLDVLNEMPGHFLFRPDLVRHVVQSPVIQDIVSEGNNCGPLAVACLLAMATLIGVSASKEKPASMDAIAEALETPGAQDMLTSTLEMAVFLSEAPEFQSFTQNTPQFEQMMSFGGLRKLMAIYAKLGGGPDPEVDTDLRDPREEAHSFHQLIAEVVKVLSSPETQEELEERMLRHTIVTSTSLRRLAEQNPQVGHLLSNPQVLAQIISYIRNPEVRREMDRHGERTLKRLEGLPGGHSILHHVYTEVEEPVWNMMEEAAEGTPHGTLGPKRSLLPPGMENRRPLPDPWAPRQETLKAGSRGAAEEGEASKKRGDSASPEQQGAPSCSSSSRDAEADRPIQGQADKTGPEEPKETHEGKADLTLEADSEDGHDTPTVTERIGSEEPKETHEGKADLALEADSKEDAAAGTDRTGSEEPKETHEGKADLALEADSEDGHDAPTDTERTGSEEPKETHEGKADLTLEADSEDGHDAPTDTDRTGSEEPKETHEGKADLTLEADSEDGHDASTDTDRTGSEEPKETHEGKADLTLEADSEDGHDAPTDTDRTGSEEPKETHEGKADLTLEADSKEDAVADTDRIGSEEPKETHEGMSDLTLEALSEDDGHDAAMDTSTEPESSSSQQPLLKEDAAEEEHKTATNTFHGPS